ncbi:MAG: phage tail protein [Burkholderia sp.]
MPTIPIGLLTNPNAALQIVTSKATGFVSQYLQGLASSLGIRLSYALLGDVGFDVVTYPNEWETRYGAEFAEHALIGTKPRLQWTGDRLDEIRWTIVLHAGFCDPEAELLKLQQLIVGHIAAPLHLGNGDYKGTFVPTECTISVRHSFPDGTLVWLEGSLTLREYVAPPALIDATASKTPVAAQSRAGSSVTPPPQTVSASAAARPASAPVIRN